jgi:hypothetical protein
VLVLGGTLLGALLPASQGLATSVYPDVPGDVVVRPDSYEEGLQRALSTALLEVSVGSREVRAGGDPIKMQQHERTDVEASLRLPPVDTPVLPGITVDVGFWNVASLDGGVAFEVDPAAARGQEFSPRNPVPRWHWFVVPRVPGLHQLVLNIQPELRIVGSGDRQLRTINETLRFQVNVHSGQIAFEKVVGGARSVDLQVPEQMTVGEAAEVSAELPLEQGAVEVSLSLRRGEQSVAATIKKLSVETTSGSLVRGRWRVTPAAAGPVDLVLTTHVTGTAGDQSLASEVAADASVRAMSAPPSVWSRLQAPALWLAPFVALVAGVLTVRAQLRRRRDGAAPAEGGS